MEDKIVDFPDDNQIPRVPPKTYKWEDVRRQKLEGSYPWTHVNKPPFDPEVWEREQSLEYEPVGLMERQAVKITTAIIPPMVKITDVDTLAAANGSNSNRETATEESTEPTEKRFLRIPNTNGESGDDEEIIEVIDGRDVDDVRDRNDNYDDDDDNDDESDADDEDDEELSPQDFQSRVEERFFSVESETSTTPSLPAKMTRSPAPPMSSSSSTWSSRERTRSQISRIKEKFEAFKEQHQQINKRPANEESASPSSRAPPSSSSKSKLKFKMKKPKMLEKSKMHLSSLRPNISFPNLHFSLSRSNSVKSVDRLSHSQQPSNSKRKFDFGGTYPRIFKKKKKPVIVEPDDYYEQVGPVAPKSAPNTPVTRKRSAGAFGQKLFNKFKDMKDGKNAADELVAEKQTPVIRSSIMISTKPFQPVVEDAVKKLDEHCQTEPQEDKPTKMIIDNKNFFFISLHEDRTDLPTMNYGWSSISTAADERKSEQESEEEDSAGKMAESSSAVKQVKRLNFGGVGKRSSLWNFALKNKEHLKEANILDVSDVAESKESLRDNWNEDIIISDTQTTDNILEREQSQRMKNSEVILEEQSKIVKSQEVATSKVKTGLTTADANEDRSVSVIGSEIAAEINPSGNLPPKPEPRSRKRKGTFGTLGKKNGLATDSGVEFHSIDDVSFTKKEPDSMNELNEDPSRFEEYESALEKSKLSSDYYSAIEIGKDVYSSDNALAGFDFGQRPRPPIPPMRTRSLYRNKRATAAARKPKKNKFPPKHHEEGGEVETKYRTEEPEPEERERLPSEEETERPSIYNTFPLNRPERPKRKFKTRYRKRSSTIDRSNNDDDHDRISMNDIDRCHNNNNNNNNNTSIANSKQLSISYLPTSDNVICDDSIRPSYYNLRETSSMIQLNITEVSSQSKPVPPKRRKSFLKERISGTNSVTQSSAANSLTVLNSITPNVLSGNLEGYELEYADDGTKTPDSCIRPARPIRKRSASTVSLVKKHAAVSSTEFINAGASIMRGKSDVSQEPVDRSNNASQESDDNSNVSQEPHSGKDNGYNGYAVISYNKAPPTVEPFSINDDNNSDVQQQEQSSKAAPLERRDSTLRSKIRRISDFFSLPRIRRRSNYVLSATDDASALRDDVSLPIRPPRRFSSTLKKEHVYADDNLSDDEVTTQRYARKVEFQEESYSKKKRAESLPCGIDNEQDDDDDGMVPGRRLQSGVVLEKMKGRPLPAPPRPSRKTKEDDRSMTGTIVDDKSATLDVAYSRCNKRTTNACSSDKTRGREDGWHSAGVSSRSVNILYAETNKEKSIERKIINTEYRKRTTDVVGDACIQTDDVDLNKCATISIDNDTCGSTTVLKSLQVSELNVGRLNVNEVESSRLVTSSIESVTLQLSEPPVVAVSNRVPVQLTTDSVSSNMSEHDQDGENDVFIQDGIGYLNQEQRKQRTDNEEISTVNKTADEAAMEEEIDEDSIDGRSRISSMIPEVGSDDERDRRKVIAPARKKNTPLKRRTGNNSNPTTTASDSKQSTADHEKTSKATTSGSVPASSSSATDKNQTLSELTRQILEICQSSVGEAIHSMVEQFAPENREKRNELQTAIWIITIIVAGCLVLGLQSEKQVHHHHCDFHFPPPH